MKKTIYNDDEKKIEVSIDLLNDDDMVDCDPTTEEICEAAHFCAGMNVYEAAAIIGAEAEDLAEMIDEGCVDFAYFANSGRCIVSPGRLADYMGYDVICLAEQLKKVRA